MYSEVDLHPSQQVSDPPQVKRNLVRNIVAQFNEEAKRRDVKSTAHEPPILSNGDVHYVPRKSTTTPAYVDSEDDGGQKKNNLPFSYTSTLPPSFMYKKSKSEYDLKSPNEVIYAHIIVNGEGNSGKKTVHTKVPVKTTVNSTKYSTLSNGMSRNQSVSMGNLQSNQPLGKTQKVNVSSHNVSQVDRHPVRSTQKQVKDERSRSESPYETAKSGKKNGEHHRRVNGVVLGPSQVTRKQMVEEEKTSTVHKEIKIGGKETKKGKSVSKDSKERIRSHSEDSRLSSTRNAPREPFPDYNQNDGWEKLEYRDVSSEYKKEVKEFPNSKDNHRRKLIGEYNVREPPPDYDDKNARRQHQHQHHQHNSRTGYDELDNSVWHNKHFTINGGVSSSSSPSSPHHQQHDKEGQLLRNGVVTSKEMVRGSTSNLRTTEHVTQEKTVTRRHRSTSSGGGEGGGGGGKSSTKEESSAGKVQTKEKDRSKRDGEKKSKHSKREDESATVQVKHSSKHQSASTKGGGDDGTDKKFYYFGANEEIIRPPRKKEKEKKLVTNGNASGLSSTKLVKEANAQVTGVVTNEEKSASSTSRWKSGTTDLRFVNDSPTGSANQDSGYFSRGGMTPISKEKANESSPEPSRERIINIEVEGRSSKSHQQRQQQKTTTREDRVNTSSFFDAEERMETSESDDIPSHWVVGGSRDSQVSAPSNQWSSLEEDDEDIIAAHVNAPQSMIREMGKREISYENSQHPPESEFAERLWFEKSDVDSDYRKEMSTGCFTGGTVDREPLRNDNHINNNWGNSATLSRLETNKNRINNDTTMRSSTMDRRKWKSGGSADHNENSRAVKILLNGQDITDSPRQSDSSAHHQHHTTGILSKTSNYASETESQHSGRSKGSQKSSKSSPALKRVNFKTRSKTKRSVSSAANLSPVHREAMLRAGSPVRPPSASGSFHSSGSEASHASNRSIILHAPTVADIPPPRYRYRVVRESTLSGSPPPETHRSGKAVTRTFSLLSPWKPKKYKQKQEQRYEQSQSHSESNSIRTSTPDKEKEVHSGRNSSEHLDSLSPLPSEGSMATSKSRESKKKSKKVVRTNSVPKDTRFAGFFKRKKEKA